jgi:hypothetical protein
MWPKYYSPTVYFFTTFTQCSFLNINKGHVIAQDICLLSPWRIFFNPRVVNVGFLVDKVALGHVSVWAVMFIPSITLPQMLHINLPSEAGTTGCSTQRIHRITHHNQQTSTTNNYNFNDMACPWFQASATMLMRSALFCDITRHRVVIVYRHFGTTYRSHLQGSGVREEKDSWPLKTRPICCPETSVNNYHTMPRNIPEQSRSILHTLTFRFL